MQSFQTAACKLRLRAPPGRARCIVSRPYWLALLPRFIVKAGLAITLSYVTSQLSILFLMLQTSCCPFVRVDLVLSYFLYVTAICLCAFQAVIPGVTEFYFIYTTLS